MLRISKEKNETYLQYKEFSHASDEFIPSSINITATAINNAKATDKNKSYHWPQGILYVLLVIQLFQVCGQDNIPEKHS